MKLLYKRKRYLFGSCRNTVTAKVFSQRNGRDDYLYLEIFMVKDGEWKSIAAIPLQSMDDMKKAVDGCMWQLNDTLKA